MGHDSSMDTQHHCLTCITCVDFKKSATGKQFWSWCRRHPWLLFSVQTYVATKTPLDWADKSPDRVHGWSALVGMVLTLGRGQDTCLQHTQSADQLYTHSHTLSCVKPQSVVVLLSGWVSLPRWWTSLPLFQSECVIVQITSGGKLWETLRVSVRALFDKL